MKPYLKPVQTSHEQSFLFKTDRFRYFPTPWHFHPEFEIILVKESRGMRIIGDHVGSFMPGDLVLIGSGIPHTYINDKKYYEVKKLSAVSIVIQFPIDFIGEHFLNIPEMKEIAVLLNAAGRCFEFNGKINEEIRLLMDKFDVLTESDRIINLLSILRMMARTKNKKMLCAPGYKTASLTSEFNKLNKALTYVSSGFKDKITLTEAAEKAGMQLQSFCRYFKQHTGKTFSNFVNDIRIGYACQQLRQTNKTIAAICFESGFENLSYFNRQFKRIKKQSPNEFRNLI